MASQRKEGNNITSVSDYLKKNNVKTEAVNQPIRRLQRRAANYPIDAMGLELSSIVKEIPSHAV